MTPYSAAVTVIERVWAWTDTEGQGHEYEGP